METFEHNEPLKWSRKELIDILKMLAEMSGILDYELLCEKFSKDVVNSLIEYNIIHLRPTSHMSFDVLMH